MQTSTHGNGNGLDDLYILPDDPREAERLVSLLETFGRSYTWEFSDVPGQEWYGKRFLNVAFSEDLEPQIREAIALKTYIATFTGRKVGSIGITYRVETQAIGKDEDEARMNLYERYEHISGLSLREVH